MVTLAHIDGYDWDIADEPITYPERDRVDACRRAAAWRRAQTSHLIAREPAWEMVEPAVSGDGWIHVGNVIEWDGARQAVHWQPPSGLVRLQHHRSGVITVDLPALPAWPQEPILPPLPEQPDTTIQIPIIKLQELLQRAVAAQREQIADPLVDRQSAVTYGIALRPYRVQPDGWVRIGGVTDRVGGMVLGVFWHPETDGLRMERP